MTLEAVNGRLAEIECGHFNKGKAQPSTAEERARLEPLVESVKQPSLWKVSE
jgi:hypothetical protein